MLVFLADILANDVLCLSLVMEEFSHYFWGKLIMNVTQNKFEVCACLTANVGNHIMTINSTYLLPLKHKFLILMPMQSKSK